MSDVDVQTETPAAEPAATKRKVRTPGAVAPTPAAEPAAVDSGLPNAIDIDPRKIDGPVLTRQGWVVPDAEFIAKKRKLAAMQAEIEAEAAKG